MPIEVKFIFTVFITVVGVVIAFVDRSRFSGGPDSSWRLGKYDPVRLLLFEPNGPFRKTARLFVVSFFVLLLAAIWLLV